MKILITTDSYLPTINGVVTSILNLENELLKRGHDVRILTLKQSEPWLTTKSNVYMIPSISAEMIYPDARILRSFAKMEAKKIIQWQPDIIHSQSEFSTFTIAHRLAKELHIPLVHTYHTVYEDYTHYFSPSKRVGKKAVQKFSDFVLGKTNGIIAPTEKVRHLLEAYGIEKPIYTIPTGVNLSSFHAAPSLLERMQLRKEWDIPENTFVMLFLGRLAKEKNVEELIRFLSTVPDKDVMLAIAGDGPNREELQRLSEYYGTNDRIRFLGMFPHDEVAEVYHLADVFVSASTSETQGLTYVEAQASGLPVICRDDECLRDLVISGQNGYIYETREEFADALHTLKEDAQKKEKMKKAAQEMANEFSSEVFGERILEMYQRVREKFDDEEENNKENKTRESLLFP